MSDLVTQPTIWPTRKVMAGLIAGVLTLGLQIALYRLAPGLPLTEFMVDWEQFVTPFAMALASYFFRERAPAAGAT